MHPAWGRNSVEKQCNLIIKCKHTRDQVYSIKTSQAFSYNLSLTEAVMPTVHTSLVLVPIPSVYLYIFAFSQPAFHLSVSMGVQNSKKKKNYLFQWLDLDPIQFRRVQEHMCKAGVQFKVIIYLNKNRAENLILSQVELCNTMSLPTAAKSYPRICLSAPSTVVQKVGSHAIKHGAYTKAQIKLHRSC